MNYKKNSSKKLLPLCIASLLLFTSLKSIAQSATIDGYPSGTKIPKSVFSSLPTIGVYVKPTAFEIKYQIISYTVKLADGEGGIKEISCQGSQFSALAKGAINDYAKPGDIISIQNIRAKAEGVEIKIPALLYYID